MFFAAPGFAGPIFRPAQFLPAGADVPIRPLSPRDRFRISGAVPARRTLSKREFLVYEAAVAFGGRRPNFAPTILHPNFRKDEGGTK
jgi:hypothetical protein